MKTKRILSLLLVMVMALSMTALAGCKGSTNTGGQTDNTPVNVEEVYGSSDLSEEMITALQNSGELTLYTDSADVANGKFDDEWIENAEWMKKYYGLTINYRYQAYGDDLTNFLVDFAANDAPDVITLDYRRWPKAGNRQIVYNLDELEEMGILGLDHKAFDPYRDLSNRFNIGDKIYSVSITTCVPVVCGVNLDLFDQYQVKSPVAYYQEGAWDMDAYITCCKELTRTLGDGTKIWGGFGWNYNWYLVANDARLVKWDENYNLKLTMNDPLTIRSLTEIQDLYLKGYTPTDQMATSDNVWKSGKLGMYLATSNNMAVYLKDVTFNWDIVPMPYGADNTSGEVPGEFSGWGVVTSTKNPQGVINLLICKAIMAERDYGDDGLYYRSSYEEIYSEDQLDMIYSYCNKVGQDLVMGVGTLGKYFKFWNDLRGGGMTLKECIDTHEPFYQDQIDLENEQAIR